MMTENETIEIDLRKLASALLRRWWILLLAACVGGGIAFAWTYGFVIPEYSATVKLYVNNSTEQTASTITSGDISASKSLVETYITIIRSDTVLEEVLAQAGLDYTPKELNKMLSAGALNATEIFYVTIKNPYPVKAAGLANAIANIAPKYLSEIVDGSSVKVVDRAKIPTEVSSPSYKKNAAVGAAAGLFLVGAVLVLLAVFDVRISSEEDLRAVSELPMLGVISDFQAAGKTGYGYGASRAPVKRADAKFNSDYILNEKTPFTITEEYKMLRTAVSFAASVGSRKCKLVGVTSPLPDEGKSITCMNMAISFAMTDARVLVVDCDLRKPSIAQLLSGASSPGMSNVLAGINDLSEAVKRVTADGVKFDVIPSGDIPPNPSELLGSANAEGVFNTLSDRYDYIFIDLPPTLPVSDAAAVSKWLTGLIMIVRAGQTKRDDVKHSLKRLQLAEADTLGFVLNGIHQAKSKRYYGEAYGACAVSAQQND